MTFGLTISGILLFGMLLAVGGGIQRFDAFKYADHWPRTETRRHHPKRSPSPAFR